MGDTDARDKTKSIQKPFVKQEKNLNRFEMMKCKYCQTIHDTDNNYTLRDATRDVDSDYPRCDWHWRFICSICKRPRHFNGITWCEKTQRFICLSCAESHKTVNRNFWKWHYYYAIECDTCNEYHPALDYLEYKQRHPWQLHPEMREERAGLDPEKKVRMPYSSNFSQDSNTISEKNTAQAWDKLAEKWSDRYTKYGDLNREHIVDPSIFNLIDSVKDLSVLDAGCGNGYLCRLLAKQGAKVVGVDISKNFIEMAKQEEKKKPLGITYDVLSLSDLSALQDETFDLIISNLVLMDVKNFEKAFHELRRVLKRGGKLVFSIMHPCFSSPPVHGWTRTPLDSDRKEDWLYWKVDRYFDRSVETWQFHDWPATYSFHRPLSDYMKLLIRNGFVITKFEEPIPSNKAMKEHFREFGNECDRIPWFLIIGAKKQ